MVVNDLRLHANISKASFNDTALNGREIALRFVEVISRKLIYLMRDSPITSTEVLLTSYNIHAKILNS